VGRWLFDGTVTESTCDREVPRGALTVFIAFDRDDNQVTGNAKEWNVGGYGLIGVFDDANGALVLSTPDADKAVDPTACAFRAVATFDDPITDPESGTFSKTVCPLFGGAACETTWTGTWVRLPQ
jgi:hypothetical protein